MVTKSKLIETIEKFPENFTIEELMDKLILLDKVDRGNQQSIQGEIVTELELDQEMQKWFK